MTTREPRQFTHEKAVRRRVPLSIGLTGASSSGKTKSALRLADGIRRVRGGDTFMVCTEKGRCLQYADTHTFHHVNLEEPYDPAAYNDALDYCEKQGAGVVIMDSMSHEHEGVGGVLDRFEEEMERIVKRTLQKYPDQKEYDIRDKRSGSAWYFAKQPRNRFINAIAHSSSDIILCFRAKPKQDFRPKKDRAPLGYQEIAGNEYGFEMTLRLLLYPRSDGYWVQKPEIEGENAMIKIPEYLVPVCDAHKQITEDMGEALATWAVGDEKPKPASEPKAEQADLPHPSAPIEEPSTPNPKLLETLDLISQIETENELTATAKRKGGEAWTTEEHAEIKAALYKKREEIREAAA